MWSCGAVQGTLGLSGRGLMVHRLSLCACYGLVSRMRLHAHGSSVVILTDTLTTYGWSHGVLKGGLSIKLTLKHMLSCLFFIAFSTLILRSRAEDPLHLSLFFLLPIKVAHLTEFICSYMGRNGIVLWSKAVQINCPVQTVRAHKAQWKHGLNSHEPRDHLMFITKLNWLFHIVFCPRHYGEP